MNFIEQLWADPLARNYYLTMAIVVIPMARIIMRAGFNVLWVLLMAVPGIGFFLCTLVLALRKWPQAKEA